MRCGCRAVNTTCSVLDIRYIAAFVLYAGVVMEALIAIGLVIVWYNLSRNYYYRYIRPIAPTFTAIVFAYFCLIHSKAYQHYSPLLQLYDLLLRSEIPPYALLVGDAIVLLGIGKLLRLIDIAVSLNPISVKKDMMDFVFSYLQHLPVVKIKLNKEKVKMENDFIHELKTKTRAMGEIFSSLPKEAISRSDIISFMKTTAAQELPNWRDGKVSGAVYHGFQDHQDLLNEAFGLYSIANPLHPDIWPSGMKYEAEVIAMTAALVNGGHDTICGSTSSGGTESIILAIKAHRNFYRHHHGVTDPEMIACTTAHAAVDKACEILGIRLVRVGMNTATCKIDVNAVRRSIGPNTVMIYSSAPSYAHGAIDDIHSLSAIACRFNIGLHVDCCLGGFVLPFMKKLGYDIPDFDFSLPGVTSMSLDTHKYGYALKGSSVVLYRHRDLRHAQYFCYSGWTGGLYATPTLAGSRSVGLIAQCWASMLAVGEDGYMKHVRSIIHCTRALAAGVVQIPGLRLMCEAEAMIVCFTGVGPINVYAVADRMKKMFGWNISSHQAPPCVHMCVTLQLVGHEQELVRDLTECVAYVKGNPGEKRGTAAIYGMTSSLPDGPVNELLKVYNDVVLQL